MFKPTSANVDFSLLEEQILKYWQKSNIVSKYLNKNNSSSQKYSFLDGPITANNPMGVHHAWGRTYKDLWQRFYTMKGKKQHYQNGFDCQGLWVEVEVEKELAIKSKKDIENLIPGNKKESIAKFVNLCKKRVLKYSEIQIMQSKRLGYFMDWDNSYFTMSNDNNYMIWNFLKVCHQNGWIYKGKDSVPWCPRCETAISQHEMLTEDYKEVTHLSVFFKLPVVNRDFSMLAWTTTPWTIPGNCALAVNPNFIYGLWQNNNTLEKLVILREDQIPQDYHQDEPNGNPNFFKNIIDKKSWTKIKDFQGSELVGLHYIGPFDHLTRVRRAKSEKPNTFHSVVDAQSLVVATKGTGILHVAPGAGEEDFKLSKEKNLAVISIVEDDGSYSKDMDKFTSLNAKNNPGIILDYLKDYQNGKFLHKTLDYTHRYPSCWRCKTELIWKIADEWYISMDRIDKKDGYSLREKMRKVTKQIQWLPDFGMDRELDWLKNMHDWLISKKNRYWGLALPIFECSNCHNFEVIGSFEELKNRAVSGWANFQDKSPHRPWIDEVTIKCKYCDKTVRRIADVGNPWLDAGIVPFSTISKNNQSPPLYIENKEEWRKWYPVDFITESFPGQFKNWFYALIAMSTVLENSPPFKTVLGFATLLSEDGKPMHKSWGNMIEFNQGAKELGVDVMRWMYIRQNPETNLLFGYKTASEVRRKFLLVIWNIYNFFITYAILAKFKPVIKNSSSTNVLDQWIISKLNSLIKNVNKYLEDYNAKDSAMIIEEFIADFSTWYIRSSRIRVNSEVRSEDKIHCLQTIYTVLISLTKLLAPMMPFITEEIFRNLTTEESVHLTDYPSFSQKMINISLEEKMQKLRGLVEEFHHLRKINNLKLRVPVINACYLQETRFSSALESVLIQELNIKKIEFKTLKQSIGKNWQVDLSIKNLDVEEGEARDIVRMVQKKRKELRLGLSDKIILKIPAWPKKHEDYIKQKTLATKIIRNTSLDIQKIS